MLSFGAKEALQRKVLQFTGNIHSIAPISLQLTSRYATCNHGVLIAKARRSVSSLPQSKSAEQPQKSSLSLPASLAACLTLYGGAAMASTHAEPTNALSIPTWVIHISSVIEWTTAMLLMWRYAEVTGALCACTYHFFYNSPQLDFLVTLQAALTWIGNATLWAAAYRILKGTQAASSS